MERSTYFVDAGMMILTFVLGVGSILLFAALGMVTWVPLPWRDPMVLLWDAALSLAFFIQHSGMVRRSFRARLARAIPDRYQGAVYSIASGVVLALVALLWQQSDLHLYALEGIPLWISRAATGVALVVLIWGALALRPFDPLGLVPIRDHLRGRSHQPLPFTVRGPYRWVRHPIYSSIILLFWSTPNMTADRLLFNLLWTGWIITATIFEEKDLLANFGQAYRDYQEKVPMLMPWRRPFAKGA